jgi:hypothetical protein
LILLNNSELLRYTPIIKKIDNEMDNISSFYNALI